MSKSTVPFPYVITTKNGNSYWELTGDVFTFPVHVMRSEAAFVAFPHLSRYEASEEKEVRRLIAYGNDGYNGFLSRHFLRFSGVRPKSAKVHKLYLERVPEIKRFIYEEGVQGVRNDPDRVVEGVLEETDTIVVPTLQDAYDPKLGTQVSVRMSHALSFKDKHTLAYSDAIRNAIYDDLIEVTVDWDCVERVYDDAVIEVQGFLYEGVPCTSDNVSDWTPLIPFEHKYLVVNEAFLPTQVN